jgi:hypothetical protein
MKIGDTEVLTVAELRTNPEAQAWAEKMQQFFFPNVEAQHNTVQRNGTSGTHTEPRDKPSPD